eukprot:CAMPEP_0183297466 /NCGR_PEP_ID=MMETSP0160_2-20130417/4755_1 /TAXON_ID=2839 ORGANISM="Odontella Sinensis, Strain Grunow 1884" /NCGR_SAMPLE_ID=MMETSP0160_2 /ASSEMBLY_ACC=CAM_ASM_000250 /LENGTH=56 /DNA_ID=CAMNT_0025459297 /DNA_START=253 /DNA_END=423 /DNA_ORIENTATION=+
MKAFPSAPTPGASIMYGSTTALRGNSMVAVFTILTTLPLPGDSNTAKKGRSRPSSV